MAANEYEALQVVVYPAARDLKNVRLTWTDLAGPRGAKIPAADMDQAFRIAAAKVGRNDLDVLIVPHALLTLPILGRGR